MSEILTTGERDLYFEKLAKYFTIIDRNLSDMIPKIVGSNLMIQFSANLREFLMKEIEANLEEIKKMTIDQTIEKKREKIRDCKTRFEEAERCLDRLGFNYASLEINIDNNEND